jgi:hypothetical protein
MWDVGVMGAALLRTIVYVSELNHCDDPNANGAVIFFACLILYL